MNDKRRFDLVSIGDSTIDTFIKIHDATVECDINHVDCKICLGYGDKIPVDSIAHGVAGNAANVAVGASKLGLISAIYTNLGDDEYGKSIKLALKNENVAGDYIKINKNRESNLSVVLTFQKERTIFVYHQDWDYSLPVLTNCSWVYLTSMAQSFVKSSIMAEIVSFVKKTGAKLAFGPGTYQLKHDIKKYPALLEASELLIANMCEAKTILGIDQIEIVDPADLLSRLLLLGPKTAVITDGAQGSYASDGNRNLKVAALPATLVEKTGAGDAYASGLISALSAGEAFQEAMVWGALNASSVIGKTGAQNGLLTKTELVELRKKHPKLIAVNF